MKSTSCFDGVVFNEDSQMFEIYVKGVLRGLATTEGDANKIYVEVKK